MRPVIDPSLPLLADLPRGYFAEESPGGYLALHIDVARAFHEAGYGPDSDGAIQPSDLAGRRPMYELELEGERFVVRRFRHGGAFRWVTRARYFDPERPFRELIVSNAVARSGIRTPQVVAARARSAPGPGWYLDIVTRRIEGARDLGEVLEELRRGELSRSAASALFRAAGELVRSLHDLGLRHADLTPRNIMAEAAGLEDGEPTLWIIDLDESYFIEGMEPSERRHNIVRLLRAVERRESRGDGFIGNTLLMRFLAGYEPDPEVRAREWRAIHETHLRTKGLHAAGWFVEQKLGAGPETRDGKAVVRSS